jgi:hypothetical protein
MGLGAGIGLGQTIAQTMGQAPSATASSQPAGDGGDAGARLAKLKQMFEQELITAEEYAAKKKQILDSL